MSKPADPPPEVRKGQGDVKLSREEFGRRLGERFHDPAFDAVRGEIARIVDVAWEGYDRYRGNPRKRKAGAGFADPETPRGARVRRRRPRGCRGNRGAPPRADGLAV